MARSFVNESAVREHLRQTTTAVDPQRMSPECVDMLNAEVASQIGKAVRRAKANGRKTIKPEDF